MGIKLVCGALCSAEMGKAKPRYAFKCTLAIHTKSALTCNQLVHTQHQLANILVKQKKAMQTKEQCMKDIVKSD